MRSLSLILSKIQITVDILFHNRYRCIRSSHYKVYLVPDYESWDKRSYYWLQHALVGHECPELPPQNPFGEIVRFIIEFGAARLAAIRLSNNADFSITDYGLIKLSYEIQICILSKCRISSNGKSYLICDSLRELTPYGFTMQVILRDAIRIAYRNHGLHPVLPLTRA